MFYRRDLIRPGSWFVTYTFGIWCVQAYLILQPGKLILLNTHERGLFLSLQIKQIHIMCFHLNYHLCIVGINFES